VARADYAKQVYKIKNRKQMPSTEKIKNFLYFPMSAEEALNELKLLLERTISKDT